jgi:glycosyltransferase involved in cell wall biosynthesis
MIAAFLNNVVPYHHARWNAYARLSGADCLLIETTNRDAFSVLEVDRNDTTAYRRMTLFPDTSAATLSRADLRRAVHRVLDTNKPKVVCLNGYSFSYNWAALNWCCDHRVPAIVCSESNAFDEPRQPWKEAVKRLFLRHCAAGLAGGAPQAAYLVKLGLPSWRVMTGYDVVDNDHFAQGAAAARTRAAEVRRQLCLPDNYFLACSRFGSKKNIPRLIEAYALYRERTSPGNRWDLVLIGEGEERPRIEQTIAQKGLAQTVHLAGARPYGELPAYYGLASGFILASTTEQWGLVVNEAMACGLPVLVSNRCGSAPDLVRDGVNGLTFDPVNVEEMAQKMAQLSSVPNAPADWGQRSREIIAGWSPTQFAEGLAKVVEIALSGAPPRPHWRDRTLLRILQYR